VYLLYLLHRAACPSLGIVGVKGFIEKHIATTSPPPIFTRFSQLLSTVRTQTRLRLPYPSYRYSTRLRPFLHLRPIASALSSSPFSPSRFQPTMSEYVDMLDWDMPLDQDLDKVDWTALYEEVTSGPFGVVWEEQAEQLQLGDR
jgi:hypothetical protein